MKYLHCEEFSHQVTFAMAGQAFSDSRRKRSGAHSSNFKNSPGPAMHWIGLRSEQECWRHFACGCSHRQRGSSGRMSQQSMPRCCSGSCEARRLRDPAMQPCGSHASAGFTLTPRLFLFHPSSSGLWIGLCRATPPSFFLVGVVCWDAANSVAGECGRAGTPSRDMAAKAQRPAIDARGSEWSAVTICWRSEPPDAMPRRRMGQLVTARLRAAGKPAKHGAALPCTRSPQLHLSISLSGATTVSSAPVSQSSATLARSSRPTRQLKRGASR